MSPRLTRVEQTERNRGLVLDAARRAFLARGYHGATLDQIADEAGFSKGVVYSQFGTKADLFLALLDLRIDERARKNTAVVADLGGERAILELVEHSAQLERSEAEWTRLVIEFRIHAARDPELNRRYAAAHERSISGVAELVAGIMAGSGDEPPLAPAPPRRAHLRPPVGHCAGGGGQPRRAAGAAHHRSRHPFPRPARRRQLGGLMITTVDTDLEMLRAHLRIELGERLPQHLDRLGWSAERLEAHQRDAAADPARPRRRTVALSPPAPRRFDIDRFELADLAALPTMTKAEMMANFDSVMTDDG